MMVTNRVGCLWWIGLIAFPLWVSGYATFFGRDLPPTFRALAGLIFFGEMAVLTGLCGFGVGQAFLR